MKDFVLFVMFFVSQPAAPDKQVWTLNSTMHFEFSTWPACIAFGNHLQENFPENVTDSKNVPTPKGQDPIKPKAAPKPAKGKAPVVYTTRVRGWCVDSTKGDSTADAPEEKAPYYDILPVPAPNGN
jgi:hypothetical protein